MLRDQTAEAPLRGGAGEIAGAGGSTGSLRLPRGALADVRGALADLRAAAPRIAVRVGPRATRVALAWLIVGCLAVVLIATGAPSVLVPRSTLNFPGWEAGPLGGLVGQPISSPHVLGIAYSLLVLAMLLAYGVVLLGIRTLSLRTLAIAVVALHAILLLSPPLQLTDVFNYLGYARLGALHHLNPYTHVIGQEYYDPVYGFSSWHNLSSPYGPLFTALSYPLAQLPLPLAYWILKTVTVAMSLGFVGLVWHCARRLGRDPRFAVAFVALNPIMLLFAIGGFHNDFFMLVPSMGAIALVLARRDRSAGAALLVAVAVKFTAILLLPFLLVAVRSRRRAVRLLSGAAAACVPLLFMYLSLFGSSIPNLSDQSSLLTDFSIPNVFGDLIGIGGGTPALLKVASVGVVLVVAHQFLRRRDWLAGAGWSTLALIVSLAWLVPWYVIWLLPLTALGSNLRLRRFAIVLTVYLVVGFVPATGLLLQKLGVNLMGGSAGQASMTLQSKLSQ